MDGILLIDKPEGFTSHDVIAKMRGILSTRRIGHAGTLDPLATGALPLFIGPATRAIDMMEDHSKRYVATFRLGLETDTQDITGTVLETYDVTVGKKEVEKALAQFRGEIMQVPPMFSAVKIDGKRLYQLAREGKTIDRPARPVTIFSSALLSCENHEYTIEVHCSAGTYIRTLCHDIGQLLGTGATMVSLRRTGAGIFSIDDCYRIEQVEECFKTGNINDIIIPVDTLFKNLPKLKTTEKQATHIFNGVRMSLRQFPLAADDTLWAVYAPNNVFIGVARAQSQTGMLVMQKRFAQEVSW